jgi:hypothetical protein
MNKVATGLIYIIFWFVLSSIESCDARRTINAIRESHQLNPCRNVQGRWPPNPAILVAVLSDCCPNPQNGAAQVGSLRPPPRSPTLDFTGWENG